MPNGRFDLSSILRLVQPQGGAGAGGGLDIAQILLLASQRPDLAAQLFAASGQAPPGAGPPGATPLTPGGLGPFPRPAPQPGPGGRVPLPAPGPGAGVPRVPAPAPTPAPGPVPAPGPPGQAPQKRDLFDILSAVQPLLQRGEQVQPLGAAAPPGPQPFNQQLLQQLLQALGAGGVGAGANVPTLSNLITGAAPANLFRVT